MVWSCSPHMLLPSYLHYSTSLALCQLPLHLTRARTRKKGTRAHIRTRTCNHRHMITDTNHGYVRDHESSNIIPIVPNTRSGTCDPATLRVPFAFSRVCTIPLVRWCAIVQCEDPQHRSTLPPPDSVTECSRCDKTHIFDTRNA